MAFKIPWFEPNRKHLGVLAGPHYEENTPAEDLATLGRYLLEEWDRIPMDVINNTIHSMGNRINAVIAARGRITKYWAMLNFLDDVL